MHLFHGPMTARPLPGEAEFDLVSLTRAVDRIGSTAPIRIEIFSSGLLSRPVDALARSRARAGTAVLRNARREMYEQE
jgi:hypothetical protein